VPSQKGAAGGGVAGARRGRGLLLGHRSCSEREEDPPHAGVGAAPLRSSPRVRSAGPCVAPPAPFGSR